MDSFFSRDELLSVGFKSVGEHVLVSRKASIYGAENMVIGNHVRIDDFCFLSGRITLGNYVHITTASMLYGGPAGITFEDFTTIAPRGAVFADSDDYSGGSLTNPMTPNQYKTLNQEPVHIGRHVILGSGTTVLPGVTVAEGCAVGAMSLVKRDTEPWMIYAGSPAKPIRPRGKKLLEHEAAFLADEQYSQLTVAAPPRRM